MAQDTMTTELTHLIHDLIGSGVTESEALEDALARRCGGWEE